MAKKYEYSGLLSLHYNGDDDILFLSSVRQPLIDELYFMANKKCTVRYWITDKQTTKEEAQEEFVKTLFGMAQQAYGAHYSEMTGYLWTDEKLNVGGHDLADELRSNVGKWLHIEIETS